MCLFLNRVFGVMIGFALMNKSSNFNFTEQISYTVNILFLTKNPTVLHKEIIERKRNLRFIAKFKRVKQRLPNIITWKSGWLHARNQRGRD